MGLCKLTALYDPKQRNVADDRLTRTLGTEPDVQTRHLGPLAIAWSGACPVSDAATIEDLGARRGSFAAARWDVRSRSGFLARDQLGVQPLFWASQDGRLYVAWEVAPLLALLPRTPGPDLDQLTAWVSRRPPGAPERLYEGVAAVPAAHALVLSPAGWRIQRYWRASPLPLDQRNDRAAADTLRAGVRRAVRGVLPADGPAGVLLSGGFDSSLVLGSAAAEARAAGFEPPVAYCVTFPDDPQLDESRWRGPMIASARVRAVRVPSGVQALTPTAEAFAARYRLPLEFPSFVLFMAAQQRAAADGVRVLLDGEGGDELFGCEPFLIADRLVRGRVVTALRLALEIPGMPHPPTRRALRIVVAKMVLPALLGPATMRRLCSRSGSDATHQATPRWLSPERAARLSAPEDEGTWRAAGTGPRWLRHKRWLLTDERDAMGVQDHLRRTSAMSGIEAASPLLDLGLTELVLGLPPHGAFDRKMDRALARQAARGLVAEVVRLRRDKTYFDDLVVRSMAGPDQSAIRTTLSADDLQLGSVTSRRAVREMMAAGSSRHPDGASAWATETWRLWAAERWLRRLED